MGGMQALRKRRVTVFERPKPYVDSAGKRLFVDIDIMQGCECCPSEGGMAQSTKCFKPGLESNIIGVDYYRVNFFLVLRRSNKTHRHSKNECHHRPISACR